MFNKPTNEISLNEWHYHKAYYILKNIPDFDKYTKWIPKYNMTEEEKQATPNYEITCGFLNIVDSSEDVKQRWWGLLGSTKRNIITSLPNFDPIIFKECTGIDVNGGVT